MLRYFRVLFVTSVILLGAAVGNGMAQGGAANFYVNGVTGVTGDTVVATIEMEVWSAIGSIQSLALEFDTEMFDLVDIQGVGPFEGWCGFVSEETDSGANISTEGGCGSLDSVWSGRETVLNLSLYIAGHDTGSYSFGIATKGGLADPIPVFFPDDDPTFPGWPFFAVVVRQQGTLRVFHTRFGFSAERDTLFPGGRTKIYLDFDFGWPDVLEGFQANLLYDETSISVNDVAKTGRASELSFSLGMDGKTLLLLPFIDPQNPENSLFLEKGKGTVAEIYIAVSPDAAGQSVTFGLAEDAVVTATSVPLQLLSYMIIEEGLAIAAEQPSVILSVGEGGGYKDSSGKVTLSLYRDVEITSVQFDLIFNSSWLTASGITGTDLPGSWTITSEDYESSSGASGLTVTIEGPDALEPGVGPIADIQFDVKGSSTQSFPLTVVAVSAEGNGGPVSVGAENGELKRVSEGTAVAAVVSTPAMMGTSDNMVDINLVSDLDVSGFQMTMNLDTTQYVTVGTVATTSRTENMSLSWNVMGNVLTVILYPPPAGGSFGSGEGSILEIGLNIASEAPEGAYDLTFSEVVVIDAGENRMEAESIDGVLWVTCGAKGDVNGDFEVNISDVLMNVNIILGITETNDCIYSKGDYNSDGKIDVQDVVAMVYAILGGSAKIAYNSAGTAVVSAEEITMSESVLHLPISIESQADVFGAQVTLSYDADALSPSTPLLASENSHMNLAYHADNGELTIIVYGVDGRTMMAGGAFVTVPFEAVGEVKKLDFGEVILADCQGQSIAAEVRPISLKPGLVPQDFALRQNYPNPFNPETHIAFSLPVDSRVELSIFNVLGQKVTTLVNTEMAAGYHHVTWNAAKAPTGVYFYAIKAGEFTATRKMVLMK